MKVVFLQDLNEDTVRYFKEKCKGHELVFPQTESLPKLVEAAKDAEVLVDVKEKVQKLVEILHIASTILFALKYADNKVVCDTTGDSL